MVNAYGSISSTPNPLMVDPADVPEVHPLFDAITV
jgi:hypothetical protein